MDLLRLFARRRAGAYVYRPRPSRLSYEDACRALERRGLDVRRGHVPDLDEQGLDAVCGELVALGVPVEDFRADPGAFERYVAEAGYRTRHSRYYGDLRAEKAFEHFLALSVLDLRAGDCLVDLASERSPVHEIFHRLTGATCFAQDIQYREGVHGSRIGGDACAMPVADGFASAATLTCSIEHFEGDGDTRVVGEMARVLRPGGRLVVGPIYMSREPGTLTDPRYSVEAGVRFDPGAPVFCKAGWGNRHGRYYTPRSLHERLVAPHRDAFRFRMLRLRNREALPPGIYLRLALVCERR